MVQQWRVHCVKMSLVNDVGFVVDITSGHWTSCGQNAISVPFLCRNKKMSPNNLDVWPTLPAGFESRFKWNFSTAFCEYRISSLGSLFRPFLFPYRRDEMCWPFTLCNQSPPPAMLLQKLGITVGLWRRRNRYKRSLMQIKTNAALATQQHLSAEVKQIQMKLALLFCLFVYGTWWNLHVMLFTPAMQAPFETCESCLYTPSTKGPGVHPQSLFSSSCVLQSAVWKVSLMVYPAPPTEEPTLVQSFCPDKRFQIQHRAFNSCVSTSHRLQTRVWLFFFFHLFSAFFSFLAYQWFLCWMDWVLQVCFSSNWSLEDRWCGAKGGIECCSVFGSMLWKMKSLEQWLSLLSLLLSFLS